MKTLFPPALTWLSLSKLACLFTLAVLVTGLFAASVWASDPPHNTVAGCSSCHVAHHAAGPTLTTNAANANLCMSCHVAGGSASAKAFVTTDQALPWPGLPAGTNAGGTSHRWDSGLAGHLMAVNTTNLSTGTITLGGAYTGYYAKTYTLQILNSGAVGAAQFSWSATLPGGGFGTNLTGTNVLLDSGVFLSFADGTNVSFRAGDKWNLFVHPDLRNPTNSNLLPYLINGTTACSTCHNQHSEAMQPFDTNVQPYTTNAFGTFICTNRHFMRIANDTHQLCNDCHAARVVTNAASGSHPVEIFFSADAYHKRPTLLPTEGGTTNLGCLTCHEIHHAPDGDGKLLQLANSVSLCADCHTLANTNSAHFSKTNGATLWPGSKYGTLMPSRSDTNDNGTCLNCHAVHGWPDAAAPTNHYPHLLADYQEKFCFACHGDTTNHTAVKFVQPDFAKYYHHPVVDSDPYRRPGRSVECVDCHNPHKAMAGSHNYTNMATAFRNAITNTPSLIGVDGVAVNYTGMTNYQVVTTNRYTYIPDSVGVTNEYQICFKCHSGYSFFNYAAGTANFTNAGVIISGNGTDWTTNMIGMWIGRSNDTRLSVITNVLNATNLAISPAFSNTTAAAQCYVIYNITAGLTPLYNTNTASFTNGGNIVAGINTRWNSGMVGTWIYNSNNPSAVYKIIAVTATNRLNIMPAYTGATALGQNYGISGDTDLAQEFSPFNKSGHPIVTGLDSYSNSIIVAGKRGLLASAMKAPWTNVGVQTMLCSDCHDATTTNYNPTAAQGPHGSAYQFMLRGPNGNNWPNMTNNTTGFNNSWCANCHLNSAGVGHTEGNHSSARCYTCHIVVPHGGKVSRLIALNSGNMPARYAWTNNVASVGLSSIIKTNTGGYSENGTCRTTCGHHGSGPVNETW